MAKKMKPADRDDLRNVKTVLRTLIGWMAQSATSPISLKEASSLIDQLDKE